MIKAVLRLRRDNYFNYDKIKDSFVPANGEICLVDTAKDGLRAVCGDGVTPFGRLNFMGDLIQKGYFHEGAFYSDSALSTEMNPSTIKVYIDLRNGQMYHYTGANYQKIEGNLPIASDTNPGIFKVYSTTGDNEDGTMTQKAITAALNQKVEVDIDNTGEILIFK